MKENLSSRTKATTLGRGHLNVSSPASNEPDEVDSDENHEDDDAILGDETRVSTTNKK